MSVGCSSSYRTTTGDITSTPAKIEGFILHPGSTASSVIVSDDATEKLRALGVANGESVPVMLPKYIACTTKISVTLSGTGAAVTVLYST